MAKKEIRIMFRKNRRIDKTDIYQMTTMQLLREYIISKLPKPKAKVSEEKINPQPPMPEEEIFYLAIVYDGIVEDVMRTQKRLAALLLSEPKFVEFDPNEYKIQIGLTKYKDEKFIYPVPPENKEILDDEKAD